MHVEKQCSSPLTRSLQVAHKMPILVSWSEQEIYASAVNLSKQRSIQVAHKMPNLVSWSEQEIYARAVNLSKHARLVVLSHQSSPHCYTHF